MRREIGFGPAGHYVRAGPRRPWRPPPLGSTPLEASPGRKRAEWSTVVFVTSDDPQAYEVGEIVRQFCPDLSPLNEFDYDLAGRPVTEIAL